MPKYLLLAAAGTRTVSFAALLELIEFKTPTLPRDSPFFALGGTRVPRAHSRCRRNRFSRRQGTSWGYLAVNLYQSLFPVVHHLWHLWKSLSRVSPFSCSGAPGERLTVRTRARLHPYHRSISLATFDPTFPSTRLISAIPKIHDEATELIPSLIVGGATRSYLTRFKNFPNILSSAQRMGSEVVC